MNTSLTTQTKSLLLVIVPIVLTGALSILDNSLKWRAEMNQKQFDRQTRILDKIMEIHDPIQREVVTQFYLDTGLFTGQFKQELEVSLALTGKQKASQTTQVPLAVEAPDEPEEPVVGSPWEPKFDLRVVEKTGLPTNLDLETIRSRMQQFQRFDNKTIFSFEGGLPKTETLNR